MALTIQSHFSSSELISHALTFTSSFRRNRYRIVFCTFHFRAKWSKLLHCTFAVSYVRRKLYACVYVYYYIGISRSFDNTQFTQFLTISEHP